MKLINSYDWNRRDFWYDAKCESCGTVMKKISGYDDDNYYNNVIPDIPCPRCGATSNSLGKKVYVKPKYDANLVI